MKKRFHKIGTAILAGICCISIFGGCSSATDGQQASENTDQAQEAQAQQQTGTKNLGEFSLEDITGKAYTNEMFQDYKLTMINLFTTWCTPCVNEIPDLEKLHVQMAGQGVGVVGILLDGVDEKGNRNEESIEKAKLLAERTGVSYPFLIPDAGGMNGRLNGIEAFPETFFVDQDGNIVGETYTGSRGLEDWTSIVETQLKSLDGEQQ